MLLREKATVIKGLFLCGVFFFSLRKETIRPIGLRFHQIQYFWDDDFYLVSKRLVNGIYPKPS